MMLISLTANIPRYFVEAEFGAGMLGIFAALGYLMVAGNTVVFALGQAASPRLARLFAAGRIAEFRALLSRLVGLAAVGGGLAVAIVLGWGRVILSALYTPAYAERADVLLWLTVAAALGAVASLLGYGMTAARCFRVQAPLFGIVALATTVASAVLIPRRGVLGAALATTAGTIVQLLGSGAVVHSIIRQKQGEP
jgi:O-antigen/teichoic acid export membrane protein